MTTGCRQIWSPKWAYSKCPNSCPSLSECDAILRLKYRMHSRYLGAWMTGLRVAVGAASAWPPNRRKGPARLPIVLRTANGVPAGPFLR